MIKVSPAKNQRIAISFGTKTTRHVSVGEAYSLGMKLLQEAFADLAVRSVVGTGSVVDWPGGGSVFDGDLAAYARYQEGTEAGAFIKALVRKHRVAVVTAVQRRRRR